MLFANEPVLSPTFLDSGAHSVHTGYWKTLPIDEYCEFLEEHHQKFRIIAVPDAIGDTAKTEEQVRYFWKKLEGKVPAEKLCNIYHLQCCSIAQLKRVVDYSLELGFKRFAVGGALGVGLKDPAKFQALHMANAHIPKDKFQIHLLGIFKPQMVKMFRPDSLDTALPIDAARFFRFSSYDTKKWQSYKTIPVKTKGISREKLVDLTMQHLEQYIPFLAKNLPELFENEEHARERIRKEIEPIPDSTKMLLVNVVAVVHYENMLRENYVPHFRHYMTCPMNYLTSYGEVCNKLMQWAWSERALFSFSTLFEMTPNSQERLLSLIRSDEN